MQSNEVWVPVVGHEGIYEVSAHGRVRSLERVEVQSNGRMRRKRGVILKPRSNGKYGYLGVSLGRNSFVYVHRAVASAFLGDVAGMDVDHRNGDTGDNHVSNLRILTHAENMAIQRERKPVCRKGHAFHENEIWRAGRRTCRKCATARDLLRTARRREARGSREPEPS